MSHPYFSCIGIRKLERKKDIVRIDKKKVAERIEKKKKITYYSSTSHT